MKKTKQRNIFISGIIVMILIVLYYILPLPLMDGILVTLDGSYRVCHIILFTGLEYCNRIVLFNYLFWIVIVLLIINQIYELFKRANWIIVIKKK